MPTRTRVAARRPRPGPARTASGAAARSAVDLEVEAALDGAVAVADAEERVRDVDELEARIPLHVVDPLRRAHLDEVRPRRPPFDLARNDRADQIDEVPERHGVEERQEVLAHGRPA